MSKLSKTQIEFKKQMQQLQNVKPYKEVIDDHNDFYHNTAYEQEVLEKYYKREKRKRIIIYLCILSILIFAGYKNIDKIDFDKIRANIEKLKITAIAPESNKSFNNSYIYTSNDINQYEVGNYNENFEKKIEIINVIFTGIINENNIDINKINEQLKNIDDQIYIFNNHIPADINTNLHNLNLKILNAYKRIYNFAILLANDRNNNEIVNNYNLANQEMKIYSDLYREELIKILKELNMSYTIQEDNSIHFTYKIIED